MRTKRGRPVRDVDSLERLFRNGGTVTSDYFDGVWRVGKSAEDGRTGATIYKRAWSAFQGQLLDDRRLRFLGEDPCGRVGTWEVAPRQAEAVVTHDGPG